MKKVLIVGGGEIGQAIKRAISREVGVSVWDKDPEKSSVEDPASIVLSSDIVFLAVPTYALREALTKIVPKDTETLYVSLSKGIERETQKFSHEILAEFLPSDKFGLLSGPMLAEELMQGLGGAAVFASTSSSNALESVFEDGMLSLEHSSDLVGTAAAGVLKNIYSVALGLSEGLGLGSNARGILFATSLREGMRACKALGGREESMLGLAGAGDLFSTSESKYSANKANGLRLARGEKAEFSEGLVSLPSLISRLGTSGGDFPLLASLGEILSDPSKAKEIIEKTIYAK